MIFEIPGDPIAQKRPRLTTRGKFPHAYDSQKKEHDAVSLLLHNKFMEFYNASKESGLECSKLAYADFYSLELEFHLSYPKTWKQKDVINYEWGLSQCDDNKDLDNLEKFILDCCKDSLVKDDRYITRLSSKKMYSETPKTVIKIMAMKNVTLDDKATEILSMIPPKDFIKLQLAVCDLHILLQKIDDAETLCDKMFKEDGGYHKQQLSSTAYTMSYLADHFGSILGKIAKKYPKYWLEVLEKESRIEENFRDGKTTC